MRGRIGLFEAQDAYGRPFALLTTNDSPHHTVVLESALTTAALDASEGIDEIARSLRGWGPRMRHLAHRYDLAGATVTLNSLPGGSVPVTLRLSLTFSGTASKGKRRHDTQDAAVTIGSRIPGLCDALHSMEVGLMAPMTAWEVTAAVRVAYDPSVAALLARVDPDSAGGLTWPTVAPGAGRDEWDHFAHDGWSSLGWQTSRFLDDALPALAARHMALLPHPVAAGRLSLVYGPPRTPSAPKQRAGEPVSLAHVATVLTATVQSGNLPLARDLLGGLPADVRIGMRQTYGRHAGAFAAALPLGVLASTSLKAPQVIREPR